MNKRIDWIDTARGIAMILVVWGHLYPPMTARMWIYSFHMPLFFFLSGYLYKKRGTKESIVVRSKKLLVPYFLTAILSFPIGIFLDRYLGNSVTIGSKISEVFFLNGTVGWNSPIWFLIVLYLVEVFFAMVDKIKPIWIAIASLLVGYLLYITSVTLVFGIQIALWMLPFYCLGMIVKKNNFLNKDIKNLKALALGITLMVVNGVIAISSGVVAEIYHNILGNYWMFYVNAIIGIFGIIFISMYLPNIKFIKEVSVNSLFILCSHYIIYYFFVFVNSRFSENILLDYKLLPSVFMTCSAFVLYKIYFILKDNLIKKRSYSKDAV
ncbi:acyltransferase family protein [Enterococcus casseliflavus]|uniref:acyltransferase family protein n=1 Tax=Enterococcus casseliflavus TaxID=37734 RepID=UPI0022E1840A|nr:acyltransferase family protein [Enterococcus casseliflavus]